MFNYVPLLFPIILIIFLVSFTFDKVTFKKILFLYCSTPMFRIPIVPYSTRILCRFFTLMVTLLEHNRCLAHERRFCLCNPRFYFCETPSGLVDHTLPVYLKLDKEDKCMFVYPNTSAETLLSRRLDSIRDGHTLYG